MRPLAAGAALAALALLEASAYDGLGWISRVGYWQEDAARTYATNVRESLARVPAEDRRPLTIFDARVPPSVVPGGTLVRYGSEYLSLMGEQVAVSASAPYRMTTRGAIQPEPRYRGRAGR